MVAKEVVVFIMGGEQQGGSPLWHRSGFGIMTPARRHLLPGCSGITALTRELAGQ